MTATRRGKRGLGRVQWSHFTYRQRAHLVWTWVTSSSVVCALRCARLGHTPEPQSVGVLGLEVVVCTTCGHYDGHRRTRPDGRVLDVREQWQRRPPSAPNPGVDESVSATLG